MTKEALMKLAKIITILCLLVTFVVPSISNAATLSKGVTLSDDGWLAAEWPDLIQTTRYQKADFEAIKSLGADHVRIIINFNTPATVSPDYDLSPVHYACLDKAIMWAEEVGLTVVIVNGEEEITDGIAEAAKERLVATWTLVASRYANKGDMIAYELFDSPGDLLSAVRASMAIPGVFAPVERDGKLLVDGGLVNPLPYTLLRGECDLIIAVDVSGSLEKGFKRPDFFDATLGSFEITQSALIAEQLRFDPPDIYLKPDLSGVRVLEFNKADQVLAQSEPIREELRQKLLQLFQ